TLVPAAITWIWIGWWAVLFFVMFFYLTSTFYLYYKNFRWQIVENGLQVRSGAWGRSFTLLNWKKLQQVQLHQTHYQERKQLSRSLFITAGGRIFLPYFRLSTAQELSSYVLFFVESKTEPWM